MSSSNCIFIPFRDGFRILVAQVSPWRVRRLKPPCRNWVRRFRWDVVGRFLGHQELNLFAEKADISEPFCMATYALICFNFKYWTIQLYIYIIFKQLFLFGQTSAFMPKQSLVGAPDCRVLEASRTGLETARSIHLQLGIFGQLSLVQKYQPLKNRISEYPSNH